MSFYIFLFLILLVVILIKRNFNQYASGLRERPNYFIWFATQIIRFKGWSTEAYCLQINDLQTNDQSGYLAEKDIPKRNQPRPKMLRAVPHRQLNQQAPDDIMHEMCKYIESISIPRYGGETLNKDLLLRGTSTLEYTGAYAIFLPNVEQKAVNQSEIAHLHSNDGSFHMTLHPADVKLLIEKQWAERFPLHGINLFNKIIISETFVLVYAAQNEEELDIWKKILHASIDYNRTILKTH